MAQKMTLMICVLVAVLSTVYCSHSKECEENGCGTPEYTMRDVTVDGCVGELEYGECAGWCNMKSYYNGQDGEYYTDTTCCRPGCFEERTANLNCTDNTIMAYNYYVPTYCQCDHCLGSHSHRNLAGSLLGATCEGTLSVFFDNVLQTAVRPQGTINLDNPARATHYQMDRYRGPGCNRPRNITLACEDSDDCGAVMGSDRQGLITDISWECERNGEMNDTNVMGINGAARTYVKWIAPNANWITPYGSGSGSVSCTTYLD